MHETTNNITKTTISGNPSLIKELCLKIDPCYQFPIDPFTNLRLGESIYDSPISVELSLRLTNDKLEIIGHNIHYFKSCAVAFTPAENSPAFEGKYERKAI